MKKHIFTLLIALFAITGFSQNNTGFTINCNISNLKNGTVKLIIYRNNEPLIMDSTVSTDGAFTFKGKVVVPELAYVVFGDAKTYIKFFIENNVISVKSDFMKLDKAIILGSKTQREYEKVTAELEIYKNLQNETYDKYKKAADSKDESMMKIYDSIMEQINDNKMKFLYEVAFDNKKGVIGPYVVVSQLIYYIEVEMLDSIVKNIDKSIYASEYVKILKDRLSVLEKVAVGKPAPDIIMADTNGVNIALSSLKGKVVLIDFWASWCRPCRAENPNVVKAYLAYKDKGFDVFGVSLDQSKENWLKAIVSDKLTWHHVSDLKYWKSEAGKLYGINSIPHSVLIDKNGIIIAHNLRGDDLLNKLEEIFSKK